MKRLALPLALALCAALLVPGLAQADFGLREAKVEFTEENGAPERQAGAHPFAMATRIEMNVIALEEGEEGCEFPECELPDGSVEDLIVSLPEGFVGDPRAVPRCSMADFLSPDEGGGIFPTCPDATVLGIQALKFQFDPVPKETEEYLHVPVYNLHPPPGVAQRLGFSATGVPVTIDSVLNPEPPHNVEARATNIAQAALFTGATLTLWGDPASPAHDPIRGACLAPSLSLPSEPKSSGKECPVSLGERRPFLTLPRSCPGTPLPTRFEAFAWPLWRLDGGGALGPEPARTDAVTALTPGMVNCGLLGLSAAIDAQPTSDNAESPSGLAFSLRVDDPGLTSPEPGATAGSDIRRAEVTLPEGMTINPSQAEGLEACSEAELARERLHSAFGSGCPAASKVGSIEVETPLLEGEVFKGSIFVAEPHANLADDSLIAIYIVIRDRELGLLVKQPAKVTPDPRTGQLVTTSEEMPQLPFSEFRLRFREGGRSPLITPPTCATYTTTAELTPWANPGAPLRTTSRFEIDSGVGGGPCPSGGKRPFEPGFGAGTLSNQAGAHSPFAMRLTRRDGDQDLTRFDAVLPKGALAKLAGVARCPEAAIARIEAKTGRQELADPSCPASSQIGSVRAGAGVGSQLTYVPGSVYLAGPVGGAPLSVVAIVPAVAGPFDVGVVSTRQALVLDPVSAEVRVDGALSEPIPHILAGIPLRVRDIQVSVDRPDFTLNPTSCSPMATLAGIWGGGEHVFSAADDLPVLRSARFQAAGCRGLGFRPRLGIQLRGGVKRGAHPALRAHVRPRAGDANFSRAVVTLPRSAFLDQAHIRTICTRVQFAAPPGHGAACPPGARYGTARAWSPLLDGPVSGPVYLRSSDNNLPDLVVALKGPPSAAIEIELSARIDSVRGGIRSTFTGIPDAPVSRFILDMQGGEKGLIVNSRHLCHKPGRNRARASLRGQNGRLSKTRPVVRAVKCAKRRGAKRASVSRALIAPEQSASRR